MTPSLLFGRPDVGGERRQPPDAVPRFPSTRGLLRTGGLSTAKVGDQQSLNSFEADDAVRRTRSRLARWHRSAGSDPESLFRPLCLTPGQVFPILGSALKAIALRARLDCCCSTDRERATTALERTDWRWI